MSFSGGFPTESDTDNQDDAAEEAQDQAASDGSSNSSSGSASGTSGGSPGGGSAPDDPDDDPDNAPSGSVQQFPNRTGQSGSSGGGDQTVPDIDGRKTTIRGPQAPGNEGDDAQVIVEDRAGDSGQPARDPSDDAFVPDNQQGLENEVGTFSGNTESGQSGLDEAAEQVEGDLSRAGRAAVVAGETDTFNLRRRGDTVTGRLSEQGLDELRGTQGQRTVAGVVVPDRQTSVPDPSDGVRVSESGQDDPRSGEAAQDAVASGRVVPAQPTGQRDAAEAASDLLGGGELPPPPDEFVTFGLSNPALRRAVAGGSTRSQTREGGGSGGLFGPDRAPEREASNPITGTLRDVTGLPSDRELTADLRAATGAPSEQELVSDLNRQAAGVVGARPRQTFERERTQARDATLTTAAQAAERAQERPLAALAVGLPAAATEPTPIGEAALLGGAAAGAIGVDLAGRIRQRQSELETPDDPASDQPSELPAVNEPTTDQSELPSPEQPPDTRQSEIGVPESGQFTTAEIDVPEPQDREPLAIRTAELVGRQQARQRQRERERGRDDRSVPVEPVENIPDENQEDTSVPVTPVSDVERGRRVFRDTDRPDLGVRVFRQEAEAEPDTEQPPDELEQVSPGTVTGVGSGAGLLLPVAEQQRSGQLADVSPTEATGTAAARAQQQQPAQQQRLDLSPELQQRQRPAQRQQQQNRQFFEEQRIQRQQFEQPVLEQPRPTAVAPPTTTVEARDRRRLDFDEDSDRTTDRGQLGQRPVGARGPDLAPNAIGELIASFGGVGVGGRGAPEREPTRTDLTVGSVPVAANVRESEGFQDALDLFGFDDDEDDSRQQSGGEGFFSVSFDADSNGGGLL